MQIKLRTGSNQALGYQKWLRLIKWAISFKMSMFLLISKSVTFVNLQSLTLCSRKQNASSVVDLKPNQFPALYWPKFSAEFSLNNRCRDYFSWKVLEQLRICYQQLQRILKTYWGGGGLEIYGFIRPWKASKDEWQHFFPKARRLLKINEALQQNVTKSVMKQNTVTTTWLPNTHSVFEF